eukprot:CAMPEP_0196582098 /NCGR_PEP_ID=MMETSP1081-20130531/37486_1 /TAXON_ID=36882 /ORGANISM="Pyramimonas amylifera, Strain CCMP720" /LENGTH=73 /DNA_ID=CAMNT_0041902575 /DNA_START=541 /DNA_END=762 /DNA_ORIENTATION=+
MRKRRTEKNDANDDKNGGGLHDQIGLKEGGEVRSLHVVFVATLVTFVEAQRVGAHGPPAVQTVNVHLAHRAPA